MTIAILVIDTNDNNKTAYNQGPLTAATNHRNSEDAC
ncbi:hypothetical protein DERF_001452 [Dermatophagoides farinae]|uniref:Uncharacterized protein n=1 Tax=Dermatophagoides farinae TaxID=6954 RepID=A0A922L8P1_DERFA|nr:hypothetical protein DERF_001452 [Dermatophagoides farinae]